MDDPGFSRLSIFGSDTLLNEDGAVVAGGFPNGRRFGDDGVQANDISFNKVFPYAATLQNGRNHGHH